MSGQSKPNTVILDGPTKIYDSADFVNSVDNTKIAAFDLSTQTTATILTLANSITANRTFTFPDSSGTPPLLSGTNAFTGANTIGTGGSLSLAGTGTIQGANNTVVAPTNAVTALLVTQSGASVFATSSAAGVCNISLPVPTLGVKYTISVSAIATSDIVVTATGALVKGQVILDSTKSATTGATTVTFDAGAALAGDLINLSSDGTNWHLSGFGSAAASITFA